VLGLAVRSQFGKAFRLGMRPDRGQVVLGENLLGLAVLIFVPFRPLAQHEAMPGDEQPGLAFP
jgi:hypothetical protein